MMKKSANDPIFRALSWVFIALFIAGILIMGLAGLSNLDAKACEFEENYGISWFDSGAYYMPGELIFEENSSDFSRFLGSNGHVYEWPEGGLEDSIYLLTMGSNGTESWDDDQILVVWRVVE